MLGVLLASDPALAAQANRIAALVGESGAGRVVLSCRHAEAFVPGLLGAWLAGRTVELLPNIQPATLDRVDADPAITRVLHDVCAMQVRSDKAIYVPDLLATTAAVPPIAHSPPVIAIQMTTSGTTERPRYVTKTLDQLLDELAVLARVFPPARAVLSTVPLSHLYGLLFGALLPLRLGARIVSHDALLPADLAAVIEREHVDLLISTPAHLRAMATATMPAGLRVISSGARMPADLHAALAERHGWHVTDIYGSTETGGIATRSDPRHAWTPLPGVRVESLGERVAVESPWCPRSELDDRIEVLADGTFQHLGRSQELVKIAGKRAEARALEAAVLALPGISDAAVLVHGAQGKEPRVALAVVGTAERDAITAAIRAQFDAVFAPKIIRSVARIPRTDRGKLDATALRALLGLDEVTADIPFERTAPGEFAARIPRDLVFVRGHFEAQPIVPGAVLVERLVWPIAQRELAVHHMRGVHRLRFNKPVVPEQQLTVSVKRQTNRVAFEITSDATLVASGHLLVE